jgi:hypothetical protein
MALLSKLALLAAAGCCSGGTWVFPGKGQHGGAGVVARAFAASTFVTGNTSDPITFSAMASGTASADRISVVGLSVDGRVSPTGVTINGVTATQRAAGNSSNFRAEIWDAPNPTGTTADVVVTFGSAASVHLGAGLWAVTGASAVSDSDNAASASANNISISALTIPANGAGIIVMMDGGQAGAITWTNATEDYDTNGTGQRISGASTVTAGTPTITADGTNSEPYAIAGAAYSP